MPLSTGCSKAALRKNIARLVREGRPPNQAYAISARTQREHCACRTRRGPRGGRVLSCKSKRRR